MPLSPLAKPFATVQVYTQKMSVELFTVSQCVIWIEGVDFSETVFDTQKLSVVRGASRALEAMPEAAKLYFSSKGLMPEPIVQGASIAALLIKADETEASSNLVLFMRDVLLSQGADARNTQALTEKIAANATPAELAAAAPFAQLKFQTAVEPVRTSVAEALARARARVRVQQLKNPGSVIAANGGRSLCEWDNTRAAASYTTDGPPKTDTEKSSPYAWSSATAARWHYGRMERQMVYAQSDVNALFMSDFQTMVSGAPNLTDHKPMPETVANKIAVFSADGDKFGSNVLPDVVAACGNSIELGYATFTKIMHERMRALLKNLVDGLHDLPHGVAQVKEVRRNETRTCFRFETLLFGGEDVSFVVPAWMGWWLARRFFETTKGWTITAADIEKHSKQKPSGSFQPIEMSFSAGLVFANVKTPIRSLRELSDELVRNVKNRNLEPRGGLDVEVLESIEPPHGGIAEHRGRFIKGEFSSVIRRHKIEDQFNAWRLMWTGDTPFPASQAHRILHASLTDRRITAESGAACKAGLEAYLKAAGKVHRETLERIGCLGDTGLDAFNLFLALQQRDFVRAHEVSA